MDTFKELNRLASFESFPQYSRISPLTLAKCGFFYSGRGDEVECFQCKTRISGWKEGDNVDEKHRLMAPHCPMVNGNCPDNVPSGRNMPVLGQVAVTVSGQTVVDGANNFDDTPQPREKLTNLELIYQQVRSRAGRNGIVLNNNGPAINSLQPDFDERHSEATGISIGETPKFPSYVNYADRVGSFRNGVVGQGQTAEGLAEAGWFYKGPADMVCCFQCGGHSKDWIPEKDPFKDHREWCQYIATQSPAPRSGASAASPPLENDQDYDVLYDYEVTEEEIEARMDMPTVRLVLDKGYRRGDVKAVIKRRLSTTGDDFPDGASLLQALFDLQDKAAAPRIVNTSSGENAITEEVIEGTGDEDILYMRDNI